MEFFNDVGDVFDDIVLDFGDVVVGCYMVVDIKGGNFWYGVDFLFVGDEVDSLRCLYKELEWEFGGDEFC